MQRPAISSGHVTPSFSEAWLRGDASALSLLQDRFRRREARAEAVRAAAERRLPKGLLDALVARNAALPPSASRNRNLEVLGQPGTVAVVTGQQMGLFLGPLFTLYKTASAIVAARALQEETGRPCVPVFWMQDEDHDLAEVDHTFFPTGLGPPRRVSLGVADAAAHRVPVAHHVLGEQGASAIVELKVGLAGHPHTEEHVGLLERAYRPEATLSEAFANTLAALFADEGLIVVDPRDARFAPFAAPLHRRALDEAQALFDALQGSSRALAAAGFGEQVHLRPGAPLSFFSPDGPSGPRYRMDPLPTGGFALVGHPDGATVTVDALRSHLEGEPLRFTTSALLRPLLQDSLLPVAGYVAGPGEVAYFAQLPALYERLSVPMPLIIPRARFRVLDDRVRSLLEKLGLSPDEVTQPRDALLARLAAREGEGRFETPEVVEARLNAGLKEELRRFGEKLEALDPSLSHALNRTQETVQVALGKLVAKYGRALAQRDASRVERVERLRHYLFPEGGPQERCYGAPYYCARFGTRGFVRTVLDAVEPFSGASKDLSP